jgi:hypothetical protein
LRYFDGTNHGEVFPRVTNDVDTVSQTTQSEPYADHHVGNNDFGRGGHDDLDQPDDDSVALFILPVSALFISIVVRQSQKVFQGTARIFRPLVTDTSKKCLAATW